jgi:YidC/Oxa1 family membrane protein insertase
MKFDRNTVIGFTILAALLFGFFFFTNKQNSAYLAEKAKRDSIEQAGKRMDPVQAKMDSLKNDSLHKIADSLKSGHFQNAVRGTEQTVDVDTRLFRITFSNKGGQPKSVELKKFRSADSTPVKLAATSFDKLSYKISTESNQVAETNDFYFRPAVVTRNADSSYTVSFSLNADSGSSSSIIHQFVVRPDDYMIDFTIQLNGASQLLRDGKMNLTWNYAAAQQESDISFEKTNTQVGYVEDGEFDYHTIGNRDDVEFDKQVKWVGVRQRFFNTYLVSKTEFSSGKIEWTVPPDARKTIVESIANMQVPVSSAGKVEFSLFYGPADYKILKQYDIKLSKLINLGQGMYAFVSPLNRYIILPVWDGIKSFVGNFGIVIALLTLFIRLLISPLTYKSYLSGAKMKALRPEIAKLKEKFGGDQQAMSMEQMKLFREAGVNPLGGCIPALFQIPIFFALYSFFNAEVDLRGADFLWSKDLAAFDDVIRFGFKIPLLGSHLSLFTITAVLTSLLISLYSMSMTPDQSNPVLKYMPYIFPIFLLFIFNSLPAALTWYYTVSNIITLILQYIIQNYIIDHDKILAKIEENRKKPKTKSKWQERMEQMQAQQKKMKEMQQKSKR